MNSSALARRILNFILQKYYLRVLLTLKSIWKSFLIQNIFKLFSFKWVQEL